MFQKSCSTAFRGASACNYQGTSGHGPLTPSLHAAHVEQAGCPGEAALAGRATDVISRLC